VASTESSIAHAMRILSMSASAMNTAAFAMDATAFTMDATAFTSNAPPPDSIDELVAHEPTKFAVVAQSLPQPRQFGASLRGRWGQTDPLAASPSQQVRVLQFTINEPC
jgi:hypothetical protein